MTENKEKQKEESGSITAFLLWIAVLGLSLVVVFHECEDDHKGLILCAKKDGKKVGCTDTPCLQTEKSRICATHADFFLPIRVALRYGRRTGRAAYNTFYDDHIICIYSLDGKKECSLKSEYLDSGGFLTLCRKSAQIGRRVTKIVTLAAHAINN